MALDELVRFSSEVGLSREQLSHIGIRDLLALNTGQPVAEAGPWLAARAKEGEAWHQVVQAVELPPLITRSDDFYVFERPPTRPNYVTDYRIVAEVIDLAAPRPEQAALSGSIVLIPQADPGYDWLFGHRIAGLVTMYGGTNSHMAIRAAEFGLPAAIGVGEDLYDQLARAEVIELDCDAHSIRVIR